MRPVSDLPDLFQDCPLLVVRGSTAVVDSLGEFGQDGLGVAAAQGGVVTQDLLGDVTVHWAYLPSATTVSR